MTQPVKGDVLGVIRDTSLIIASHIDGHVHEVGFLGGLLGVGNDRIPIALGGGGVSMRKRVSEGFKVA
jgi:hypothetical protein